MDTPRALFVHELKTMYDAERRLIKALGKMSAKVRDEALSAALRFHLEASVDHVERLEEVFWQLELKPKKSTCDAVRGLVKQFEAFVKEAEPSHEVLDAYALSSASQIELYEISAYASLIEHAVGAGLPDQANLLERNLIEERDAYQKLLELAPQSSARLVGSAA
jgi:ferritin-like metal-binding protein YciE